jgi:hypothetical protein
MNSPELGQRARVLPLASRWGKGAAVDLDEVSTGTALLVELDL